MAFILKKKFLACGLNLTKNISQREFVAPIRKRLALRESLLRGSRYNLTMKLTRVAPVKGTRNARTSLAFLAPCIGLLRAVYLGR
jgi:hypothetical protein